MIKPSATLATADKLDHYFQQINKVILSRQNPITGLFPASTEVNTHGNYTDAWVRDNVYTIQSVWGLGLAYRKAGCDNGRAYLLEQAAVKMMRGLLVSMMKQADKVERFKRSRSPYDALHAKYDTQTGNTVVADHEWGHLQLDATGIFMLMLAQMTKSGLRIVYSIDEVCFIQNLVYYLGRAYRTPDFGIWERGNKINDGQAEINASSLGMVKAALEAVRGINLFCDDQYQDAIIHVVSDSIAQSRITLETVLPRESTSKEVDAALLSIIGYPAFAVEDAALVEKTRSRILSKLGGRYGCKRFLLDGHQTALEDTSRLHYEADELKKFEHIESEWPLFFTYLFIESLFRGDYVAASHYRDALRALSVERNGLALLPELYYVPDDNVAAEKEAPGSQARKPNNNIPLVWAQSLYYLGCLLDDGLLNIEDIDPLNRFRRIGREPSLEVLVSLLAENNKVKKQLASLDLPCQTVEAVKGVAIHEPRELARVFSYIGANKALQLSGRPIRRMRMMTTSQAYFVQNKLVVFLPQFQQQKEFYLSLDNHLLVSQIAAELSYLCKHWDQSGQPLLILTVSQTMLDAVDHAALLDFLAELKTNIFNNVNVSLRLLSEAVHDAGYEAFGNIEGYEFLQSEVLSRTPIVKYLGYSADSQQPIIKPRVSLLEKVQTVESLVDKLFKSVNLYQQMDLLEELYERFGFDYLIKPEDKKAISVRQLVDELYRTACDLRLWGVIRKAAGLLDIYNDRLDVAVQEVVIRQKRVMVGRNYNAAVTINEILTSREVYKYIKEFCDNDVREAQMNQEVLSIIGLLLKAEPELFDGILTIRIGYLLSLCLTEFADEKNLDEARAFDEFSSLSPFDIQLRLRSLLGEYQNTVDKVAKLEALHYAKPNSDLIFVNFSESDNPEKPNEVANWKEWRKQGGLIQRLPKNFYQRLWGVLSRCKGIVIGDKYNVRRRLETAAIHGAMTPGERSFALLVDQMLGQIYAPEYRHITIEAVMAIAAFVEVNPDLHFDDNLIIDVIIEHALKLDWYGNNTHKEVEFMDNSDLAWDAFYNHPPHRVAIAINMALEELLEEEGHRKLSASVKLAAEEAGQSLGFN